MLKASWMAQLVIGMLLSAAGFADDAKSSNIDGEPLPVVTVSVETLLAELGYASRWQLFYPVEAMAYSDNWLRPIADLDFQDASALSRIRKLRSLSLLTLAEIGQTRLFLGVDEEGLVGLHFSTFLHYGDERCLELIRMPYLKEKEPNSEIEQLGPESN
jgi:hypothetical protein